MFLTGRLPFGVLGVPGSKPKTGNQLTEGTPFVDSARAARQGLP